MELGYILSLIILGVSLVILIVMGFVAMKKMRPTFKNIQDTQKVVEGHMEHFTHEAELIQEKVDHIMTRVDYTKNVSELKVQRFDEFSNYASSLSESLMYLKEHGGDFSKGVAENTFNELKTDGPILAKTFKLAFRKTLDKQKMRHQTDSSAQVPAVIHHELANIER